MVDFDISFKQSFATHQANFAFTTASGSWLPLCARRGLSGGGIDGWSWMKGGSG